MDEKPQHEASSIGARSILSGKSEDLSSVFGFMWSVQRVWWRKDQMQKQKICTPDAGGNGSRCLLNGETTWLSNRSLVRLFADHEQIRLSAD